MKDFTIKEIADLTQVVKSTVRNAIKKLEIECDYIDGKTKTKYYSWEHTKKIIIEIKPSFDVLGMEAIEADTLTAEPVETAQTGQKTGFSPGLPGSPAQIDQGAEIQRLQLKIEYQEELLKQLNKNLEDLRRENTSLIADKNLQRVEISSLKEQIQLIETKEEAAEPGEPKGIIEKLKYLFRK